MVDSLEILPKTVRDILKINNEDIVRLCKSANMPLKQNEKGLTYFTTDDLKTLKRLQDVQNQTKYNEEKSIQLKNGLKKLPVNKNETTAKQKENNIIKNDETIALLKQITGAVKNIEDGFYSKFSTILEEKLENKLESKLEEKLGGIDTVIMDLVRSKSEADDMRKQIADNKKEIYALKNELSRFKKIAGNFYIKKDDKQIFDL
ncbi:hypothetical protein IJG14_05960 [bacterium]|nr:hypothetical protein [bacterium]